MKRRRQKGRPLTDEPKHAAQTEARRCPKSTKPAADIERPNYATVAHINREEEEKKNIFYNYLFIWFLDKGRKLMTSWLRKLSSNQNPIHTGCDRE